MLELIDLMWARSLAETGADAGVVSLIATVAGVLAGLGALLVVLRFVQRRREAVAHKVESKAEHGAVE